MSKEMYADKGGCQSPDPTQSLEFRAAQIQQLYAQSQMGIYWALLSIIIVGVALREQVSWVNLGIWVLLYLVIQVYRYHLVHDFSKYQSPKSIISWGQKFSVCTIASGVTWGLAALILFPARSPVHQMFLVICLSGIASAAASVYSPLTICFLPTVLAILVPLSARFFYQGHEVDMFIGIVMLVLTAALVMTGKRMNAAVTESLRLRFENKDLLHTVTGQKRIAENLLKEIHHRVKNNLQVLCSLLRLQARHLKSEETRLIFRDTETRVRTMAMLHEALYQSKDLERIPVKNYVRDLATEILQSYSRSGQRIGLNLDVEDLSFPIDVAIPCGLIITELITNSLKHAFSESGEGEIVILLKSTGEDELELVVRDNGQGMSREVIDKGSESLGLNLVRTFVKQLRGEVSLNGHGGIEFRMRFRSEAAKKR